MRSKLDLESSFCKSGVFVHIFEEKREVEESQGWQKDCKEVEEVKEVRKDEEGRDRNAEGTAT